jgi:hypothetical protein
MLCIATAATMITACNEVNDPDASSTNAAQRTADSIVCVNYSNADTLAVWNSATGKCMKTAQNTDGSNDDGSNAQPSGLLEITISGFSESDFSDLSKIPDSVKWLVRSNGREIILASTKYDRDSFTIKLPATIDTALLEPLFDTPPQGITISNPNAKCIGEDAVMIGYKNGVKTCVFAYEVRDGNEINEIKLTYVNADVQITGTHLDRDVYNLNLIKGWNLHYVLWTPEETTISTTKPNVPLIWKIYDYNRPE